MAQFYPRTHNMGIKRSVYEKIGGFGDLRHGQDIEFSNRIRKAGSKIKFIKNAIVYHRRRTRLKQFIKQVFNWGVARINLGKIDQKMLEPIHFMPAIGTIASFCLLIFALVKGIPFHKIFMFFSVPLVLLSILGALTIRDIRVIPILWIVIPAQIVGYGIGFIQAYVRRFIFSEGELIGFKKSYYK